jgi:hypothetical protein
VELIVKAHTREIDAYVRRHVGGDQNGKRDTLDAAVFCDPVKLQMEVLRP